MSVQSVVNQYEGVNPLLMSLLETEHDVEISPERGPSIWPSFHSQHINDLVIALSARLNPLGYVVVPEQGLQVHPTEPLVYPDGTVYDHRRRRPRTRQG